MHKYEYMEKNERASKAKECFVMGSFSCCISSLVLRNDTDIEGRGMFVENLESIAPPK